MATDSLPFSCLIRFERFPTTFSFISFVRLFFFPLREAVPRRSCPSLTVLLVRLFCAVFYSAPRPFPLPSPSSYKPSLRVSYPCSLHQDSPGFRRLCVHGVYKHTQYSRCALTQHIRSKGAPDLASRNAAPQCWRLRVTGWPFPLPPDMETHV